MMKIDKSDGSQPAAKPAKKGNPLSPTSLLQNKAKEVLGCDSFSMSSRKTIQTWWHSQIEGIYQSQNINQASNWEDLTAKETRIMLGLIN